MPSLFDSIFIKISSLLASLAIIFTGATSTPANVINSVASHPSDISTSIATSTKSIATSIKNENLKDSVSNVTKTTSPKIEDQNVKVSTSTNSNFQPTISSNNDLTSSSSSKNSDQTVSLLAATSTYSLSEVNKLNQNTAINIICTSQTGGYFKPISGTGVIVNSKGLVLTAAHVAQYFLLKDYPKDDSITCVGRLGNPARPVYKLEPVFISPKWITAHRKALIDENATENGESDFALLRIVGSYNTRDYPMDKPFPFVAPEFDSSEIKSGTPVLIAGFPAGFAGGITIALSLYRTATISEIGNVFNFSRDYPELFSVGGTIAAQKGISGGAVIDERNKLLGIVVTSTEAASTDKRDLRALSIPHISDEFKAQTDISLNDALSVLDQGDLFKVAYQFKNYTAPDLTQLLINVLERNDN